MLGAGAIEQPCVEAPLDLGVVSVGMASAEGLAVHVDPGFEEVEREQEATCFG